MQNDTSPSRIADEDERAQALADLLQATAREQGANGITCGDDGVGRFVSATFREECHALSFRDVAMLRLAETGADGSATMRAVVAGREVIVRFDTWRDPDSDEAIYLWAKATGHCLVCCEAEATTADGERCAGCDTCELCGTSPTVKQMRCAACVAADIEREAMERARDEWRAGGSR